MSLIKQLNESANQQAALEKMWELNVSALMESADVTATQLDEAATQWIAKLRYALERGRLDPRKQPQFENILGSLLALSDENVADALDEKGDMGSLLDVVSGEDSKMSNAALRKLVELGRHPSIKTYVQRAKEIIANPKEAGNALKQVQTRIDQTMRRKVQQERGAGNSNQALKTPLSQPKATTPGLQV